MWMMNDNQFVTKTVPTNMPTLSSRVPVKPGIVDAENKLLGRDVVLTKVLPGTVESSRNNTSKMIVQPNAPDALSSQATRTDRTVRPYYTFKLGEIQNVSAPVTLSEIDDPNWQQPVQPLVNSTTSRATSKVQDWNIIGGVNIGHSQRGGMDTRNYYKDSHTKK